MSGSFQKEYAWLNVENVDLETACWRLYARTRKVRNGIILKAPWFFMPPSKMAFCCRAIVIVYNSSLLNFYEAFRFLSWLWCSRKPSADMIWDFAWSLLLYFILKEVAHQYRTCCHCWPYYDKSGIPVAWFSLESFFCTTCTKVGLSLRPAALWAFTKLIQLLAFLLSLVFSVLSECLSCYNNPLTIMKRDARLCCQN